MAKIHKDTETALVIEFSGGPRPGTFFLSKEPTTGLEWEKRKNRALEEFEQLINRHIAPHFSGDYRVYEIHKQEFVCSSCGYNWGEKSDTFNGGCCDEDMKNDPDALKIAEEDAREEAAANGQFGVGA